MARQTSPQRPHLQADTQGQQWDDADWDVADPLEDAAEHDEAAGQRRLLARSDSGGLDAHPRRSGGRLLRRTVATLAALMLITAIGFAGLWLRLGAGPISLDLATPWLAAAIEDNIGHGNTVEVGGTQIERAGRIRIAVRIRDIVVRDQDKAIVASAPKAEVRLSGAALLMGQLRAESLKLVDAELAIRITPDGTVTVSTGETAKPLATGVASKRDAGLPPTFPRPGQAPTSGAPQAAAPQAAPGSPPAAATVAPVNAQNGLLAGLDWLDSLSLTGLDGQNLNEIGLKNGVLTVDDQQRGNKWTFENISLSLRRPSGGGVAVSLGEEGAKPWLLRILVGPQANGVRTVELKADKVSTSNILLALRLKDLTYMADLPLTGDIKGELGRDGLPTYLRGKINIGAGNIIDTDTPDYPMAIDQAELSMEWDAGRRVLVAPFKVVSGANRVTLNAYLEPPNDGVNDWRLSLNGGTILLGAIANEAPLIFNRISVNFRFDTEGKRVLLTQAEVSNGEIGVAGTGSVDYAGEPRLKLGFAATPMPVLAMKRIWPALIVPEVRAWIIERIERGSVQRIDVAVNSPTRNLPRKGPPIPDDGLDVNIVGTNVTVHPVDGLPSVRDADIKAHVTGRTATVTIGQGVADTPAGRKLNFSDVVFEVPDMAPKPSPSRVRMRVDGQVAAAAEILASDRLNDLSSMPIDANQTKGTFQASVNLAMPVKGELTKADTNYSVSADLNGFAADKLVMSQKLEANTLKLVANNAGYQVKGDVKINGQPATLDYRKPAEGDADVRMQATLDDESRARLGMDLGAAVTGRIPLKLNGKIAGSSDRDSRIGVEADLTQLKLDNLLPGWMKAQGKAAKATFNVVAKPQSTRFEDISIEGGGASMKGSLEVDQNGDLMNANFPIYSPSDGDKTQLKAERGQDGVLKLSMRGDVFDGRGFLKSAISGSKDSDRGKGKSNVDFDAEIKLGAVAGFNSESMRSVDVKVSRRGGAFKSFNLAGKIGRDTPVTADLRVGRDATGADQRSGRRQAREVILLATDDAGAFLNFTDTYTKVIGGQLELAMEPPTADSAPKEGLVNMRNFSVKGEPALDRALAGGGAAGKQGVGFNAARAEFTRQPGLLSVRDGTIQGPAICLTIEGSIDYNVSQVRMSGTMIPACGLNNIPGQIPLIGLLLGNGNREGVFGVTFEVVGTPGKPVVNLNPVSAIMPGVFRNIFRFNTGQQPYAPADAQPNN